MGRDAGPAGGHDVARTGRVVATVTYSFLTSESDPDTTDFTRTQRLLGIQLAEVTKNLPA